MMIQIVISILIPIFMGFMLSNLFYIKRDSIFSDFWIKACLGVGLGFGISSSLFFVWLVIFGKFTNGFILLELILSTL